MRSSLLVSFLASLTASGLVVAPAVSTPELGAEVPASSECIQRDQGGRQLWIGESPGALQDFVTHLTELSGKYPEYTTGVAYCSLYDGAMLFLPKPTGDNQEKDLRNEAQTLSERYKEYPLHITETDNSIATLRLIVRDISTNLGDEGIFEVGPNIYTGGINISVERASSGSIEDILSKIDRVTTFRSSNPVSVSVTVGEVLDENLTRSSDSPAFSMGAGLYSSAGLCSAGVPIVHAGKRYLLTAGHCTATTFYNGTYTVGTTHTTSYPGNVLPYGDWKLLKGNSYASRIFSGSLSSNSTLPISGGH